LVGFALPAPTLAAKKAPTAKAEKEYGDAWADLGNYKQAVEHYQRAVKLNPKMTSARLSLANGLYRMGDKQGALEQLSQLAKLNPKSSAVACAAGVIELDTGQAQKACQSFARALSADKLHPRSLYGSGQCHHALFDKTKQDTEKKLAMQGYEDYLKRYPQGAYSIPAGEAIKQLLYGAVGTLFADAKEAFARGKFRLAEKHFRDVVKQRDDLQEAHYLLGMTLASPVINKMEEAVLEWEKAGDMKEALLQRGIVAYEDEDLGEAEDLLNQAVKQDSKFAQAHYYLGLVYRDQLKNKEAMESFRQVTTLAPNTALAGRASSKLQVITGELFYLREGEIIDTSSEVELGRKLSGQIEKQFGLVKDDKLQQRLNGILRKLVAHSDRLPGSMPYHIKVLNVDGLNALAFIGGNIYLFKGLVDFIRRDMDDSDDAFASVIGHEVVHVVMRHGLGMLDLVGGARPLMEGRSFDVLSLNKLMMGISRKHEFEADQVGALYAYRAGFDPSAAYRFHRKLIAQGKDIPDGMDHPTHAERSARMKEYLLSLRTKARHFDEGLKSLDNNSFEEAIVHFEVFLGLFPNSWSARNNLGVAMHRLALAKAKEKREYKLSTDIDPRSHVRKIRVRAAEDEAAMDRSLMIEAAEVFRSISEQNPKYIPSRLNMGSCLLALGKNDEARKLFEGVLKGTPSSPEARTNLAVLKLLGGKPDDGIDMLKQVIQKNPAFADAYYNLALAFQKAGQKDEARKNWLAYLDRDKNSGWAESARKHLAELK
jgi:predicted Zn-dependent protease